MPSESQLSDGSSTPTMSMLSPASAVKKVTFGQCAKQISSPLSKIKIPLKDIKETYDGVKLQE